MQGLYHFVSDIRVLVDTDVPVFHFSDHSSDIQYV